jgi:hypothetical protein
MENEKIIQQEDDQKLAETKKILQSILDKHLPPEVRFSVKDFDREEIWYVSRLLLEKDDKKRELIRNEISEKVKNLKHEYETKFSEVMKYKELFDNQKKTNNEKGNLLNDIESDKEIDTALENI